MTIIYTNTKSKIKPKQRSKREREQYAAWCKKLGIDTGKKDKRFKPLTVESTYRRQTEYFPSLNSITTGPVNTGQTKNTYTGSKIIGIATMHKSNLVPIFSEKEAVDVSTMRRN